MNRKTLLLVLLLVAISFTAYFVFSSKEEQTQNLQYKVVKGTLRVSVTTTGELQAINSVEVLGPMELRTLGVYQVKINSMVPEGTRVQKGDFVAELDRSAVLDKLREKQNELTKAQSQFTQSKLDTTLQLAEAREQLKELLYQISDKKLTLEQSAYEPPATIKKAELDLEKTKRSYEKSLENYEVKVKQAKAKMQEVQANLLQYEQSVEFMTGLMDKFTINAPEAGMIVYKRNWDGVKVREGTQISVWDPSVASLPDLSSMVSKTYVNEVDISKITVGQQVSIGIDAFPDKKLSGKVQEVANVGEQKPNSDAKVFEVMIRINESDTTLRPSMTSSNEILCKEVPNVLLLPLEAINSGVDKFPFVFLIKEGKTYKQEVKLGENNENEVIVLEGLSEGDEVLLNTPANAEKLETRRLSQKQ